MRWPATRSTASSSTRWAAARGLVDADALHGKPAVLVDRRHAGMHTDFVSLDNAAAMKAACGHLVDGGYRELLYITEPLKGVSSRRERTAAFGDCVAAHEPRVAGEVFECTGDDGDGLDAALRALHKRAKRGKRRGRAGGQRGRHPARGRGDGAAGSGASATDIGFVGFDDPEWAPLIGPGLSAIAQPTDAIGRTAATCLIERLHGLEGPARQLLLPGELVVRGSSPGEARPDAAVAADGRSSWPPALT